MREPWFFHLGKAGFRVLGLTICLVVLACPVRGQALPTELGRIADEGKQHPQGFRMLTDLCTSIGARLTGSPELSQAEGWAIAHFKQFGCVNVHVETWGTFPVGFDRGPIQICRTVEPFRADIPFTTPAWTNGTAGLKRGAVMRMPGSLAELRAVRRQLRGKWLCAPWTAADPTPAMEREMERDGVLGRFTGSRSELVVTSGPDWKTVTFSRHPGLPHLVVRQSDFDRMCQALALGQKVVLEADVQNRWFKGPVTCTNVVADIRGVTRPNEMVIVGGHLDSWDGPGSQGAQDNGFGAVAALEAARILTALSVRPDRTIRFVLWTGEEQGLLGSAGYVRLHKAELDGISAVLVDDDGAGYQAGYTVLPQMAPMMNQAIAEGNRAFPDMPQELTIFNALRLPRGGGSDQASFNAVRVPGFFARKVGGIDYRYVHHTQHDRLETIEPKFLVQSATNHALVAYYLACAPDLLPREPRPGLIGGQ